MCKDYERELSEWLKDSKEKVRRAAIGDLGVRVQGAKAVLQLQKCAPL